MVENDPHIFMRSLDAFSSLDHEMPLGTMQLFMFVAGRGSCNQKDIEVELGLSNGATSRNVAYWSDGHKASKLGGGLGLLDRRPDPSDRRYNIISLTPEGKKFYEKLLSGKGSNAKAGRHKVAR